MRKLLVLLTMEILFCVMFIGCEIQNHIFVVSMNVVNMPEKKLI